MAFGKENSFKAFCYKLDKQKILVVVMLNILENINGFKRGRKH